MSLTILACDWQLDLGIIKSFEQISSSGVGSIIKQFTQHALYACVFGSVI